MGAIYMDVDCILVTDWLQKATTFIADRPEIAVVCGRRRERFPEASIYNRFIDMEWDTPTGDARACGGTHHGHAWGPAALCVHGLPGLPGRPQAPVSVDRVARPHRVRCLAVHAGP